MKPGAACACFMLLGSISAACVDRGFVGARDAAAAPAPPACEPACADSERCLLAEARCVECLTDADCSGSIAGPRCYLESNLCGPCPAGESCGPQLCVDDDEPFDLDDDCDEADGGDDDDELPDF